MAAGETTAAESGTEGPEMTEAEAAARQELGVEVDASESTARKAYRRRALATHPEVGGSAAELKRIEEAWETIKKEEAGRKKKRGAQAEATEQPTARTRIAAALRRGSEALFKDIAAHRDAIKRGEEAAAMEAGMTAKQARAAKKAAAR